MHDDDGYDGQDDNFALYDDDDIDLGKDDNGDDEEDYRDVTGHQEGA